MFLIQHVANKSRWCDYAKLVAYLNNLGKTYQKSLSLHPCGADHDDTNIIGEWGWNNDPVVANRVIVPRGPIDFTKVTETQGADIGSVTENVLDLSSSTFIVNSNHILRIWNTTDNALVADVPGMSWMRSGLEIAVGSSIATTVASLIASGKSIRCWCEGLSELSIGGAGNAIELGAGSVARFATGLESTKRTRLPFAGVFRVCTLKAVLSAYTCAVSGDRVMAGWSLGVGQNRAHGLLHAAGGPLTARESDSVQSAAGGVAVSAAQFVYTGPYSGTSAALNMRGGGYPTDASASSPGHDIDTVAYATAVPYLSSNKVMRVTRLESC